MSRNSSCWNSSPGPPRGPNRPCGGRPGSYSRSRSVRRTDISRLWNTCSLALGQVRPLLRRQVVEVLEDPLERPVGVDELRRGLLADAGHAGEVVALVAPQRRVVDVLLRRDAGALEDAGLVVERVVRDAALVVEDSEVRVADELVRVTVAGHDDRVHALRGRAHRERADHVVGLDPGDLEHRDRERLEHLVDQRQLAAEQVRRLLAARPCTSRPSPCGTSSPARRTRPRGDRASRRRAPSRAST